MADVKLCNQSTPHKYHGWGAGPPWHVCPGIEPDLRSPDCREGKHRACRGDSYDLERDVETECPCPCHLVEGASGDKEAA